jgi:hypothetical protein
MYCTDAGLNWLDAIDYYINFVMTLVGIFETLVPVGCTVLTSRSRARIQVLVRVILLCGTNRMSN